MAELTGNYYEYSALAGDTFDAIALDFYDEEAMSYILLKANPTYRNVLVFEGGEILIIPVVEKTSTTATLPPWKRVSSS